MHRVVNDGAVGLYERMNGHVDDCDPRDNVPHPDGVGDAVEEARAGVPAHDLKLRRVPDLPLVQAAGGESVEASRVRRPQHAVYLNQTDIGSNPRSERSVYFYEHV